MKTFKYIALAALVCSAQQTFSLDPQKIRSGMGATAVKINTVPEFSTMVTSLSKPLDKILTKGAMTSLDEHKAFYEMLNLTLDSIKNYLSSLRSDAFKNDPINEKLFLNAFGIYDGMQQLFAQKYAAAATNMTYTDQKNQSAASQLFKMISDKWKTNINDVIKKFNLKIGSTSSTKMGTTQHLIALRNYTK